MRRVSFMLLTFAAALLVAPQAWASWPQFRHGPARNGSAGSEITAANAATLKVGWTRPAPAQANLMSNPAVVDHHVFVADGQGHLYSYGTGGALAWRSDIGGFLTDSSPAIAGGRVFVGSCDTLYAFDEQTGTELWEDNLGPLGPHACAMSSPAVSGGLVYVASESSGRVHVLDATSGVEIWHSIDVAARSSVGLADGLVLVGSNNQHLYAFPVSCQTPCQPAWARNLGNVVEATPVIAGGLVYTHSWTSPLLALRVTNGTLVWQSATTGGGNSSPAVAGGVVYDLSSNGLAAYDAATGAVLWTAANAGGFSSPSVGGGVVTAGYRGSIRVFDRATGTLLRTITGGINGRVWSGAAFDRRAFYATREDDLLYKVTLPNP
jgi:outer membrane protein assembly factor BamB